MVQSMKNKTKSPIKDKLLRYVAQSADEAIDEENSYLDNPVTRGMTLRNPSLSYHNICKIEMSPTSLST